MSTPAESATNGVDPAYPLIDVDTREGLLDRYSSDWVTGLPQLVAKLVGDNKWRIVKRLVGGRTACVLIVAVDGRQAVLKVTPAVERSARELAALEVMSQHQIGPRVLQQWIDKTGPLESSVALLELIGDGRSFRHMPSAEIPPAALAGLLSGLAVCAGTPLPVTLPTLQSHLIWRLDKPLGGGLHGAPPSTATELQRARHLLTNLTQTTEGASWVHGTLHPGNLVFQGGKVWAIDPRPFHGDSAYDVAELALKWGSERQGREHNMNDGLVFLEELRKHYAFDKQRAADWMQVIVTTGV